MPRPIIPADLHATITRHLDLFRGWQMMADEAGDKGADGADAGSADQGASGDQGDGDKPLGPNGEKALAAEREARKESDRKVSALEAQMTRLAEALGVKPDAAKADGDDQVKELSDAVSELLHNTAVERVAREHGITDKSDLDLLREQGNEQAMEKLAKRLQPAKNDDDSAKPKRRTPAPDPSQGRGAGSDKAATGVSAGRDLFRAKTTKTT